MSDMPLLELIRLHYPEFSKSERMVADYICNNLSSVSRMSIREIKDAAGVSEPTVYRFCQVLGFQGFKDFKISLAEQTPTFKDYFAITHREGKSDLENLVERLLLAERDAIDTTLRILDYDVLEKAAQAVVKAKRICLFGSSTSYDVCRDVSRKFNRLGLSAWAYNDFHDALPQLSQFDENDLLLCISQSGNTREPLDVVKNTRDQKIPVLLITAFTDSRIAEYADLILRTYTPEVTGNRLGITTRFAQYSMTDALYMAVARLLGEKVSDILESSLIPLMRR